MKKYHQTIPIKDFIHNGGTINEYRELFYSHNGRFVLGGYFDPSKDSWELKTYQCTHISVEVKPIFK